MTPLLDAALDYARRGWPVLPLHNPDYVSHRCSCGKADCSSPGKHPRLQHGLHEASTDDAVIRGWWGRWPLANVGLRTGVVFDVLDVDGDEGADSIRDAGDLPIVPEAFTGGGGNHLLFIPTGAGNRAGILPKVDWRGKNGYIVAAPSLHVSGDYYAWMTPPSATPLEVVPPWLAALVTPTPKVERAPTPIRHLPAGSGDGSPYGIRALEAEIDELSRAAPGMRNHNLNGCAFNLFQLVAGGELQDGVVTDRLRSTGMAIGLGEVEIEKTIGSARIGGTRSPRSAPPQLRMIVGGEPLPPEPEEDFAQDYEPEDAPEESAEPEPDQDIDTFLNEDEPDYDWVIPGLLERGDRCLLTGAEGGGKALAVDTAIPCQSGWTTMGDLTEGDEVFSEDGSLTRVLAVTDVMIDRPCYQVSFSDGSSIVADAGHLWKTETLMSREASSKARSRGTTRLRGTDQTHKRAHFPALVTTEMMAATVSARQGHALNHSIPTCDPLDMPAAELPIDPYILGVWLGDGHSAGARLTCADPPIIQRIRGKGQPCWKGAGKYGWGLTGSTQVGLPVLLVRLRLAGLLNNKHIPVEYLRASPDQRLELLQGLMDTDGSTTPNGVCEFSVCNQRLARGVHELLVGLGIKVTWREGPAKLEGRVVGTRYRLCFQTSLPVFSLPRKARRMLPTRTRRPFLRYVVSVEPVESVPVRCIQVEHPSGMFLAGKACIPTHNSTLLRQIAIQCGAGIHPFTLDSMEPITVMYVDLENSKRQVRRKMRPLRLAVKNLDPLKIRIRIVTQGIDLLRADHVEFLEERIKANKPDLLIMGPLYRLVGDDPVKEEPARIAAMQLDRLRSIYGFALLMEAHSPHASGPSGHRPERPYGASLWMRWPEFGIFLDAESGALRHWRGARDEREWPTILQRGGEWPWTAVTNPRAVTFARIIEEVRLAGKRLSVRELADRIKGDRNTVQRAIDANRKQWEIVLNDIDREEF